MASISSSNVHEPETAVDPEPELDVELKPPPKPTKLVRQTNTTEPVPIGENELIPLRWNMFGSAD